MPRIITLLLGAVALIIAIVGIRSLVSGDDSIARVQASTVPTLDKALPVTPDGARGGTVEFIRSRAQTRTLYLSLGGRSEAEIAPVSFGAAGKVTALPVAEGAVVAAGTLLCGLEGNSSSRIKQAETAVAEAKVTHANNVGWLATGFVSEARVKQSRRALDDAQAALEAIRTEMAQRQAVAPFRGVFEKRTATMGEFVTLGGACGTVVRLDPITFVAGASEKQAVRIRAGASVRVKLPDGREVAGTVEKISSVADPQTRNFEVKVSVANADNAIPVGRTAELKINIGLGRAHHIPQTLLKTDQVGRIGIYYLDVGGVIGFAMANIVDDAPDGVWVTGLPDDAQLVAEGQDDLTTGQRVTPVVREDAPGGG